ncbi:MAG TPA: hypothetical protein VHY91_27325 [Pirellulales bacterium]|jgi:hypothetical protein|nr:hypothetical protein [Pirellulales bacterium]
MNESLLPSRLLFRYSVPCRHHQPLWSARGVELSEAHRLPDFGQLESRPSPADVRMAWSHDGLALDVRVVGKRLPAWCRDNRLEDSDSLQVWIDTRDTHNIHRASRFCHRFIFLPAGGGRQYLDPVGDQLLIDRARENARPVRPGQVQIRATLRADGYQLCAFLPAGALTGFEPDEHPRLGFTYRLFDREFGEQTFSASSDFPFAGDPSLWATLELVS